MSVMPIRSPQSRWFAGAGGGGDVGGKLGGHGVTVQVLVVVVAGRQCEGERRKCKNLVFIISVIILVKFHFNNCCTQQNQSKLCFCVRFANYLQIGIYIITFTSSQPLISAPSTSMPSGVSTSVPPRVSDSPFPVLNSLRASVRSLFSVVGVGLPST